MFLFLILSLYFTPKHTHFLSMCIYLSLSLSLFVRSSGAHVVGWQVNEAWAWRCDRRAGERQVGAHTEHGAGERRVRAHARCKRGDRRVGTHVGHGHGWTDKLAHTAQESRWTGESRHTRKWRNDELIMTIHAT